MSQDASIPVQEGAEAPPPRDYRIATPEGWERVVLNPETWDPVIARIVDDQFKGQDNVPHIKAQLRESLRRQAAEALANGGLELYLSLMRVADMPLPGSLVVTFIPPRGEGPPPPLEDLAMAYAAKGENVRMISLPAGPALRRNGRRSRTRAGRSGTPGRSRTWTSSWPCRTPRLSCCCPSPPRCSRSPKPSTGCSSRSPRR